MLPNSLEKLLAQVPPSQARWASFVLNAWVALAAPLLALLTGHLIQAFSGEAHGPIVSYIPALGWMPEPSGPLARISYLLVLTIGIAFLSSVFLYFAYRMSQKAAVELELVLFGMVRKHIKQLARFRTLSAQQTAVLDGLEYHLPRIRGVLARYWQTIPRHVVQLALCFLLAVLIHLPVSLLAVISGSLFYLLFRYVERVQRSRLPVIRENAGRVRGLLVNICLRGPLLNAVQEESDIEKQFGELKQLYQRDAVCSLSNSSWKVPTAVFGSTLLFCLLAFVVAAQWFQGSWTAPQLAALTSSLGAAAYSSRRLWQVVRELKQVSPASSELNQFLEIPVPEIDDERLSELDKIGQSAELEHATVQDSQGRKLLEDVTAVFKTGQLIAIVAEQPIEARTLAELLIGLGRPTSGRMLIDGLLVSDLKSDSLTRCAHWVSADGGIMTGTIAENLRATSATLMEQAIERTNLSDLILRMSEGAHTLITHDDDRLSTDEAFRLGIARAWLRNASIVVVEEPETEPEQSSVDEPITLEAIRALVSSDRITMVLPQRLGTLKHCDQVVFVYQHRIQDIGPHLDLIQKNDLYRHWIYMRFNAFRL